MTVLINGKNDGSVKSGIWIDEKIGHTMSEKIWILWWMLMFVVFSSRGNGLRLINVTIPAYKLRGEMAILECNYELDGAILYATKWYKDNEEFYRYVPKINPPQHSYKVEGIKVDHSMSDSRQVVLRGVNLKSSGLYRCEISAEGPSFASAHNESRMEVVFLPKDGPHITGEEKEYQAGEEINLNCTSGKSFPSSTLHWYINDEMVTEPEYLLFYPNVVHTHGLLTTVLGLQMPVSSNHFIDGKMKAKCVASVSPVLWQGNQESIVQRVAPLIDNREALVFVKGSSASKLKNLSFATVILSLVVVQLSSS